MAMYKCLPGFFLNHLNMWCIYSIDKGDPCGNVCQNGGICELIVDSASWCKCPLGFTGEFCQNGNLHFFYEKVKHYKYIFFNLKRFYFAINFQ